MQTVKAGDGVTGTFATVKRDDGTTQVTYAGAPIYYFAKDTKAGDVTGQGVGGVWFVAAVAGGPGGADGLRCAGLRRRVRCGRRWNTGEDHRLRLRPGNASTSRSVAASRGRIRAPTAHTVTADDGSFDSKSLASNATFSQTFAKAGTFAYHCAIHPGMKGTVTVQ